MPNFLVLSSARSGSSLFANYLNSHHDVKCWGEILNPESGINPRVESLTAPELLYFVGSKMSCTAGSWVGAKIHTHQLYELPISLSTILERAEQPHVLVLYREALLDTYVSLRIALENNVWYSTDVVNNTKIRVDWNHFEKYARRERVRWQECLRTLDALRCPTFVLSFEGLVENTQSVMNDVFQFLGNLAVPVETESVRQNPSVIEQKISNWNELPISEHGPGCRLVLRRYGSESRGRRHTLG